MVSSSAPKERPSRGYLLLLLATACQGLTVLTEGVALECEAKVDAHRDVDHDGHTQDGEVHLVQGRDWGWGWGERWSEGWRIEVHQVWGWGQCWRVARSTGWPSVPTESP